MERVHSAKAQKTHLPTVAEPPTLKGKMRDFRFAMMYLKDPNATRAAIACGIPPKGARVAGTRLLTSPNVRRYLDKAQESLGRTTNITVERLLQELGKVAFASMQDYWTVDDTGNPKVDFSTLTPEQWAAIGEITIEEYMDGKPGHERPVKKTKFKLHDKLAAIDKALRHLGGFNKDNGGAPPADTGAPTVVYTLNIGNANIVVSRDTPDPKLINA